MDDIQKENDMINYLIKQDGEEKWKSE